MKDRRWKWVLMLANSVFGGAGSAGGAAWAGEQDKSLGMKPQKNRVKASEVEKMREGKENGPTSLLVMSGPELRLELH